jgi:hypothetical protein
MREKALEVLLWLTQLPAAHEQQQPLLTAKQAVQWMSQGGSRRSGF